MQAFPGPKIDFEAARPAPAEGHILDFRNWLPAHLSYKTVSNILGSLHDCLDVYTAA
jgi:hypothetical protein